LINNIQTLRNLLNGTKRTNGRLSLKIVKLLIRERRKDLTTLDEKVEGQNLDVESKPLLRDNLLQLVFLH